MKKEVLIPVLIGMVMILVLIWVSWTMPVVLVFIPGVLVTFLFYKKTYFRHTPGPQGILPLYLLALGIQFIHFTEEYVSGFTVEIPKLWGQAEYPVDYWVAFNMFAYFIFIVGGIILFEKKKEYMIIPLFFIVVGVIFNTVVHILTAIYVGGYFPGLYSVLLYLIVGPLLVSKIIKETKVPSL